MNGLDREFVQRAIVDAGQHWIARAVPAHESHGLGWEPSPPQLRAQALERAHSLIRSGMRLPPHFGERELEAVRPAGPGVAPGAEAEAALAAPPASFDWRTHGVIVGAGDQGYCGACVSFATTGMLAAMADLELGVRGLVLSAADQHFCSSHGANCHGWNSPDALGQLQGRGVVPEDAYPYMSAFDNPPQGDPADVPDHLWIAHCRPVVQRTARRFRISDYTAWTASMPGMPFDARKYYLANHGPLVVGFTVYQDFDNYGGGVFRHVTGTKRGGHCVLVVGYDDTLQAWICRNSWGTGFGGATHPDGTGGGFFMIGYGDSGISDTMYGCHGVRVPTGSRLAQRVGDLDGDGHAEFLVSSPWGLGVLKQSGATMTAPMMAPNGTRFGGWLLNTADNSFGAVADYSGDGRAEVLLVSPWGIGVLGLSGGTMTSVAMAPNGSALGGWVLDTSVDEYGPVGDLDGDGKAEIVVRNPSGVGVLEVSNGTFSTLMTATNGTRFGGWLLNSADNVFGPAADLDGDGRAELVVASPWGVGVLKLAGGTFAAPMMAQNGTRFGGWLLNTGDNQIGFAGDLDGDGRAELVISSPWGLGVLRLSGSTLTAPMMAQNGTRFGGWLLNTADNTFGPVADFDGDGRAELLVTSPWGLGVLRLSGSTMTAPMMAQNGTRFGGWLLNTADNHIGRGGRGPGAAGERLLFTSPWGIGLMHMSGSTLTPLMMAQNGSRFGGWLLNTADNEF